MGASALVLAGNMLALTRVRGFPWQRFFEIARWALVGYAIVAGMIEYVFLRNQLSGGPLVVMTVSLILFAFNVPILIAFTVARYRRPRFAHCGSYGAAAASRIEERSRTLAMSREGMRSRPEEWGPGTRLLGGPRLILRPRPEEGGDRGRPVPRYLCGTRS